MRFTCNPSLINRVLSTVMAIKWHSLSFSFLSDGVGRTGVFCALCIVLERMRCEGVVDLFQTVKLLRTQRPNMIQNQVGISQSLFVLPVRFTEGKHLEETTV